MITELVGFTLARAIPDKALVGVLTGTYKVFGGVIRDNAGRIVAHLASTSPVGTAVSAALEGINTYQLHKIGRDIGDLQDGVTAIRAATSTIVGLAQATTVLSGLTLAVSAASFVFLSHKLSKIDRKVDEIAKDVKAVRAFLESQERAALIAALKTLSGIEPNLDDRTRIPLLIDARQTLGEIHQKYRDQLLHVEKIEEVDLVEEYFSLTALGHALCSAELDMYGTAVSDLGDAYSTWQNSTRRICADLVLREDPERMLMSPYATEVRTDEIIDWLDFAHGTDKEIEWIDGLRKNATPIRLPQMKVGEADKIGIQLMRKVVARDRILQGFRAQYQYLASAKIRPSDFQQYVDGLDPNERVAESFLFVANERS